MDNELQSTNMAQLIVRRWVLQTIIEQNADDPRIEEPKRQLAIIEAEISRRENENPNDNVKPEDDEGLVVGLKTLNLKVNNDR